MVLLKKGFVSEMRLQSRRMERSMKPSLTVACFSLKSVWQAVSLRSALTALLLAPLAALHAQSDSPAQPFGVDQLNALRWGTNDFTFTSAAGVTVTALSVRVVP